MTVNYYAFGPFQGGEDHGEGLHIGQSAQGSKFLMRAHPDLGLTNWTAWKAFLDHDGITIADWYGNPLTLDGLRNLVLAQSDSRDRPLDNRFTHGRERPGYHVDAKGVEFCALEFS